MSYIPNNLRGPDDNLGQWTRQYPSLLKKNFIGISRIWDKQAPPVTFQLLPPRPMPFHFAWQVAIDPSIMAPYVQEGADTPMADSEQKTENFVCKEARLGSKISQRAISFGIKNIVQRKVTNLVDAVNLTRVWENIQALTGTNANQSLALTRLNTAVAGQPHGSGTAKGWDEESNTLLKDIIAMKTDIQKKSGHMPEWLFLPIDEYEYLHDDSNILDQLKYTSGTLLVDGRLTRIKGLKIVIVPHFWKERAKTGVETKHWLLQDKAIVACSNIGFTAVAEPQSGSAPVMDRWYEKKARSVFIHGYSSFTSVIEDYGKIGIISGTNSKV